MRRPLSEYSTLRRGYERQRRQEAQERMLQVATLKKSYQWFMHSLESRLTLWKQEIGQIRRLAVILLRVCYELLVH